MMDFSLITDEPLNYCVYAHVNKTNGKMYIGITCRLEHRWSAKGYYYKLSTKFYRAIQKYGWENFEHIVLIDNISESMACIFEKELIKKYNTRNEGYNILSGGKDSGSVGKKVYQYDFEGNYIAEWDNGNVASIETGVDHVDICACARKDSSFMSAGGFQWRYYKADKIQPYQKRDQRPTRDPVLQFSKNGELIQRHGDMVGDGEFELCKIHRVVKACNSDHFAYKTFWFWEKEFSEELLQKAIEEKKKALYQCRLHDEKKVCQYTLDGHLLHIYDSVNQAFNETQISTHNIYGACNREEKKHYTRGYLWYYYEQSHGEDVPPFDGVQNKQKLYQYSMNGDFIKEYAMIADANKEFCGLKQKLQRGINVHNGFLWFKEFKGNKIDYRR